ncbi:hypothetical protein [Roseovarius aestuariivivens]|uniref:hypothetical protein n=1 Tax=Roseovarius aestuariivivens TaxID=1888910 RepID=UPI001081BE72|nr:hypothetical protein [Roseovarius aestuariivivens]
MTHFPIGPRAVPRACFAILILPVAVYLLHEFVMIPQFGVPVLNVTADDLLQPVKEGVSLAFTEAAGRSRFIGAFLFFCMVVVIALVCFAAELLRDLDAATRRNALLVFVAVQIPVVASVFSEGQWRAHDQLGEGVLRAVMAQGDMPFCDTWGQRYALCGPDAGVEVFGIAMHVVTIMSGLGVSALILGMILSLARPKAAVDLTLRAFDHGRNQRIARRFLYLAGLMMSAGLYLTMSWMHWPFPMLGEAVAASYKDVINAQLFYYGIFYTLLIITGFGPVIFLAARRSDALAMESVLSDLRHPPQDDKAKTGGAARMPRDVPSLSRMDAWKEAHGLRISFTEAIQALVATGSPLLTAFAGSFSPL